MLVTLNMLIMILDIFKIFIFLQFLTIHSLKSTIYFNEIATPFFDVLTIFIFLIKRENYLKLFDDQTTTFNEIIIFAIK